MNTSTRIAKNTILLYIRMALIMMVTLFTTRVVLRTLGVVDYGVYNVVGGIVSMLTFLNGMASSATSRFLTFSLGSEDNDLYDYNKFFCAAFFIHIVIAVIVVIIGETIGLWYVLNKMVIPDERIMAAVIVYQISLLSCFVSFSQVPYNASIIAHENMNIYAYVGIYDAVGRLVVAALLYISPFDRLVVYAVLQMLLTVSISIFYRFFCVKKFKDKCKLTVVKDKRLYKMLIGYSGWDLIGNFGAAARSQGTNLILNLFCGPVVNAARGVAYQVESALNSFTNNFQTAMRPSIIKSYASGEIDKMRSMLYMTCRFSNALYSLIAFPIILETDNVLKLWLGEVPDYSALFIKIVLTTYFFSTINSSINIGVHATGDVKRLNIFSGTKIFIEIPVIYLLLNIGFPPYSALVVLMIGSALVMWINLWVLKLNISSIYFKDFIRIVILRLIATYLIPFAITYSVHKYVSISYAVVKLVAVCVVYWIALLPAVYYITLDYNERTQALKLLTEKINKRG